MQRARSRKVQIALVVDTARLDIGQVVQLLHVEYDLSLIEIVVCGCALFPAQQVLLGEANAGIMMSDAHFRTSVTGYHIPRA
jgi:hypothetical protein